MSNPAIQNDLNQQILLQKIKNVLDKEFDEDLAKLFPDTINFTGLIQIQTIRDTKRIAKSLEVLAQLDKETRGDN